MTSQFIEVKAADGGCFSAYLATPRQGTGPGLVLLQEIFGINDYMKSMADLFAEEGYVAIVPDLFWRMELGVTLDHDEAGLAKALQFYHQLNVDLAVKDIEATVNALRARPEVTGKIGAVGYCLGGKLAYLAAANTDIDCAVSYYGVGLSDCLSEAQKIQCPIIFHFAERDAFCPADERRMVTEAFKDNVKVQTYTYLGCDHAFATTGRSSFDKPATMMAYSRTLSLLRNVLGPVYDLNNLWEQHCYYEFGTRAVDPLMKTMVASPYVNHVPTMTGGVGHDQLKRFYKYHFLDSNPEDTRMIPISRTIGTDRIVDEFVFCCTHTREIDWMLPGIKPTERTIEIPMLAVIHFRGDKLFNEHIYWDQASVLVQIGLLDGTTLPIAGYESAKKLLDETQPSNRLMGTAWSASEGKPV